MVREIHVIALAESLSEGIFAEDHILRKEAQDNLFLESMQKLRAESNASQLFAAILRRCLVITAPRLVVHNQGALSNSTSNNIGMFKESQVDEPLPSAKLVVRSGADTKLKERHSVNNRIDARDGEELGVSSTHYHDDDHDDGNDDDRGDDRDDGSDNKGYNKSRSEGGSDCQYCRNEDYDVPHTCWDSCPIFYVRDAVHYIYELFKKGSIDPEEPFLRISERIDQQNSLVCNKASYLAPGHAQLRTSKDGYVLVWSSTEHIQAPLKSTANICVYIITQNTEVPTVPEILEKTKLAFETVDVYHTMRQGEKIGRAAAIVDFGASHWNLENTYGAYSQGDEFYRFLCPEGAMDHCPVMQGSPRALYTSGSYAWQRNYFPGTTGIIHEMNHSTFIQFKVLFQELSFWQAKAVERSNAGIYCCEICAEELEYSGNKDGKVLCLECYDVWNSVDDPCWSVQTVAWAHFANILGEELDEGFLLVEKEKSIPHNEGIYIKKNPGVCLSESSEDTAPRSNGIHILRRSYEKGFEWRNQGLIEKYRNKEPNEDWLIFDKYEIRPIGLRIYSNEEPTLSLAWLRQRTELRKPFKNLKELYTDWKCFQDNLQGFRIRGTFSSTQIRPRIRATASVK